MACHLVVSALHQSDNLAGHAEDEGKARDDEQSGEGTYGLVTLLCYAECLRRIGAKWQTRTRGAGRPYHEVATRKLALGDQHSEEMPSVGGSFTWKSLFGFGAPPAAAAACCCCQDREAYCSPRHRLPLNAGGGGGGGGGGATVVVLALLLLVLSCGAAGGNEGSKCVSMM